MFTASKEFRTLVVLEIDGSKMIAGVMEPKSNGFLRDKSVSYLATVSITLETSQLNHGFWQLRPPSMLHENIITIARASSAT